VVKFERAVEELERENIFLPFHVFFNNFKGLKGLKGLED